MRRLVKPVWQKEMEEEDEYSAKKAEREAQESNRRINLWMTEYSLGLSKELRISSDEAWQRTVEYMRKF